MKINLKRFLAILTTAATVICAFSSCAKEESSVQNNNSDENLTVESVENESIEEMPAETQPITEAPTEAPRLSDECDKVLATGHSTSGSFYELVANETEDYSGTTIEIGVIENNKWLIPLTTDSPFISDSGLLVKSSYQENSIHDYFNSFEYVGSDCFIYRHSWNCKAVAIWNVKKNIGYVSYENEYYEIVVSAKATEPSQIYNEGIFMLTREDKYSNVKYLKADTMACYDTGFCPGAIGYTDTPKQVYPFSNGLFAVQYEGFYNLNGELVIPLDEYDIKYMYSKSYDDERETISPPLIFKDDKCEIPIKNDQGTSYIITIDTTGKVINSVKAY